MNISAHRGNSADSAGRRLGRDRRSYSYFYYIPERRSARDRRCGTDRRTLKAQGYEGEDRRSCFYKQR